ncbi:dihydroxyacetone kinase subunit DhaK [Streptomyces noursei]
MGIHGEPGLRTTRHLTAAELTDELVGNLLPELPEPPPGGRGWVAVLLNGLGRTKYEELFVVYRQVNRRLREAGLRPFRPEVGEFVTSFDMAGVSLSLMLLDDELAELYDAPCDTPAFRSLPGRTRPGTTNGRRRRPQHPPRQRHLTRRPMRRPTRGSTCG